MPTRTVAIACQGGGSHAAFAAGALRELLEEKYEGEFRVAAISGTSGGAACAALAWSGLVRGGREKARAALEGFWSDLSATCRKPLDMAINLWGQFFARLPFAYEISPYTYTPMCAPALECLLQKHVKLDEVRELPRQQQGRPMLFVGATDICNGNGTVTCGCDLTYDDLIASAAIPTLFRAVHTRGTLFWDGLFGHNPPIRQFTDLKEKPDEIWVLRINPQARKAEPMIMHDIVDRRNELSGNLSLNQELAFIDKVNELLEKYASDEMKRKYQPIAIHTIEIPASADLDLASKLDRSAILIRRLMELGRKEAPRLLDESSRWHAPARDRCTCDEEKSVAAALADVEVPADAPVRPRPVALVSKRIRGDGKVFTTETRRTRKK